MRKLRPVSSSGLYTATAWPPFRRMTVKQGTSVGLSLIHIFHCYDITNVNKALLTKWAAASGSQELDALLAGDKDALSDFQDKTALYRKYRRP